MSGNNETERERDKSTNPNALGSRLPADLMLELKRLAAFHIWGSVPESTTDGGTVYDLGSGGSGGRLSLTSIGDSRGRATDLLKLCEAIASRCKIENIPLPNDFHSWFTAGRMYKRSADYVKCNEYFLKALHAVHHETILKSDSKQ